MARTLSGPRWILGCYDKLKEFTAGYLQEGFGEIHLQLMRPYDIKYCLQICYVIVCKIHAWNWKDMCRPKADGGGLR